MRAPLVRLRALARHASGEAGLTLPELLISMAILGTVLAGVVGVFAAGTRAQTDRDQRFRSQVQLDTAIGKLRRDVHNACGIAIGWTTSSVTLQMPAQTVPQPPDTPCTVGLTGTLTWCASGSGSRYALYRVPNSATCVTTGQKKYADYLTSGVIFPAPTYTARSTTTLGRLLISFTVDERPGDATRAYTIADEIVLRNSITAEVN